MPNLFDDENGVYVVLINDEGQYSLWPVDINVPSGWRAVHGPVGREACRAYIETYWIDMRPKSLSSHG